MKGLGNIGDIMKQAQKMQKRMEDIKANLQERVVEATSGGGMVTVQMNGKIEPLSIKIDKEVVDPGDVQMLEDLVLAAVTQAIKKAQDIYQTEMNKLAGGVNIPGLADML
ncbi:MAG: YbaB/EbfC family nucleoid-associated protein [Candidatus Anammoxibacter sp.]